MADITEALAAAAARHQAGDFAAAEQMYRAILQQIPTHPPTLCNLGALLARQNRLDEAARCYAVCLAASPDFADAHFNFGNLYRRTGQLREAVQHYQNCVRLRPDHASAYFNMGLALSGLGDAAGAAECFRRTAALEPNNADAYSRLGDVLMRSGLLAESIDAFSKAAALRPDDPRGLNNLALAMLHAGRTDEAARLLEHALQLNPDYAEAHNAYALVCEAQGKKDDATRHYQEAVRINPNFPDAWSNLGTNLTEQGRIDEAIAALAKSLTIRPNAPPIHSNLLLTLNYSSKLTPEQVAAEHFAWARRFAPVVPQGSPLAARTDETRSDRRLKIGYISADFRSHTVAGFIEQLFTHHDREQVHVTAYSNVSRPDETTERLQALADDWRPISGQTDDQTAELIRCDEIDVLIDLSGHTAGNRLLTLARRPAPVQCTLFGYPNTTGLAAVDYRITDDISDPPGQTEHLYAERLLRLPTLPWVYRPPDNAPDVTPLPGLTNPAFTLGCLNNAAKISDACLDAWVKILNAVPAARLVLLSGQSQAGAARLLQRFTTAGIAADRVRLVARLPKPDYFAEYGSFDLALDPFPYNGGVTTCDALWMGVPVLAVAGASYVSRQGAAILTHAGLPEFIAETPDALADLVKKWSEDRQTLAQVRANLRERMANSPVADGPRYVRSLETALRQVWRN
jgi:predicted O-linked N-acetylglucosamine transferase (SPINDLY family)